MGRIKLTIEYDGSEYVGWQKQQNGRSIQEEIENTNIIKDVDTSTKVPRIKYTPSFTPKAEPVVEAFSRDRVNMVSPTFKVVFP